MIIIFVRALILYTSVLIAMRIMGKGEIAQMQPYELVVTLMIAELAVLPMENLGVPLINGIVAIGTILLAQITISVITLKSTKFRALICGKPSILINKGKINEKELKKIRININDLIEQLRAKNYPYIADVEFAILETNGDLSVIPKPNKKNITVEDMDIQASYEGLPITLIIDGKINYSNLKKSGFNETWLFNQLKTNGKNNIKQILLCYVDSNNKVFIYEKNKRKKE